MSTEIARVDGDEVDAPLAHHSDASDGGNGPHDALLSEDVHDILRKECK